MTTQLSGPTSRNYNMSARYSAKQAVILGSALKNVASQGFDKALISAVRSEGYSDATLAVLKPFDVIMFHLEASRLKLAANQSQTPKSYKQMGSLVQSRLQENAVLGNKLGDALKIMTIPSHLSTSLNELHLLSDEVAYLGGDRSTGADWYSTRTAISAAYTASELFMSKDVSSNYSATMEFVRHRFAELDRLAYYGQSTSEWLSFNAISAVNVFRSLTR